MSMNAILCINTKKCIGCSECVRVCSKYNISMNGDIPEFVSVKDCNRCLHCVSVCPVKAIEYDYESFNKPLDELAKIDRNINLVTAQDMLSLIKKRRTVRHFKEQIPSKEELSLILEAANYAPSAGNRQPLRYVIIQDKLEEITIEAMYELQTLAVENPRLPYAGLWSDMIKSYRRDNIDRLFYHAPVVIAVIGDSEITKNLDCDCGIAAENMSLMAETMGLGTCMNAFFAAAGSSDKIKELLKIKKSERLLLGIAVGYPDIIFKREVARNKLKVFCL